MARRASPSQTLPYPVSSVANGVSQQAPTLRLPNQVEEAINIRSTILGGVGPRSGSTHRGRFARGATHFVNAKRFQFDRGVDGKYLGIATPEGLRIWNADTYEEASVTYPDGMGFFTGLVNPNDDLAFVSAGNYLFMANSRTEVKMTATVTPSAVNEAFVFCKASSYDQRVTINLTNNATGASLTWVFDAPKTAGAIAVALNNTITAQALAYGMVNNVSSPPANQQVDTANKSWVLVTGTAQSGTYGYTVSAFKNLIRITRADGADFSLTITDASGNGNNIAAIKGVVKVLSDLPAVFYPNSIIRIAGVANDTALDYWVQYVEKDDDGKAVSGYWKEVPAPGTKTELDAGTMPWGLVLLDTNSFKFSKIVWDTRIVGSEKTLPPPSFVGSRITGLCFTRARLGLVMPDGIVCSRSDDNPFGFWRQSSTQQLDTDPIDLINGTEDVVEIHSVCLVGQDPVMFSSKRQLALLAPQGNVLSPNTAELMAVSAYQTPSGTAEPIAYGTTAFFATPGTSFTGVEQFSLNVDTQKPTGESNPVTDHVPAYIPAKVWQFAECSSENLLFVVAGADRNLVFAYQYLDTADRGRVQSAWSKWAWDRDCQILNFAIFDKKVVMLILRSDAVYLETMDLSSDRLVGPYADDTILDRKHVPAIDYDETDYWTYIVPEWPVVRSDANSWFVITRNADGTLNEVFPCQYRSDNLLKVTTDLRGKTFEMGRSPRCFLQLSEPVARPPGSEDGIYNDVTIKKIGPVFGQSTGCVLRVSYKSRRHHAKLLQVGQSLRWDGLPEIDMATARSQSPAAGEYLYIFQAQAEDTAPKRYVSAAGKTTDVMISFENLGPRSFKVVGAVYILSVTPRYTGL